MIDFDDGSEAFQSMNINSAPVFMHFPPKGKPKKVDNMDIQRVGYSGEALARYNSLIPSGLSYLLLL